MPIVTKNPSGLKLKFDCGKDDNTGKSIIRSKTYTNINPEAEDEKVYEVGTAIATLQQNTLMEVAKIDNKTLSE